MDDAAPTILRLPPPAWDAESAARRIAQLESALMRRSELLEQKQAQLEALQNSGAWQAVRWYYKLRERLLPLHSRRRRLVRRSSALEPQRSPPCRSVTSTPSVPPPGSS